jgi:hypothetical protein
VEAACGQPDKIGHHDACHYGGFFAFGYRYYCFFVFPQQVFAKKALL